MSTVIELISLCSLQFMSCTMYLVQYRLTDDPCVLPVIIYIFDRDDFPSCDKTPFTKWKQSGNVHAI